MPVALTPWMKYSGPIAPPTSSGFTPVLGPSPGAFTSTFGAGPDTAAASGANAEPVVVPLVSAVPPTSGLLAVVLAPGEVLSTAGVATALWAGTAAAPAAAGNAAVSAQRRSASRNELRIVRLLCDGASCPAGAPPQGSPASAEPPRLSAGFARLETAWDAASRAASRPGRWHQAPRGAATAARRPPRRRLPRAARPPLRDP